jgi:hypothetical protein
MNAPVVKALALGKRYGGRPAVEDVSFRFLRARRSRSSATMAPARRR